MSPKTRIMLVDDHALCRSGLTELQVVVFVLLHLMVRDLLAGQNASLH